MDIAEILTLPESKTLEFKRDLSSLNPILKTVVAFANTAGGTLIIGKEADGAIVGVDRVFASEGKLANAIADSIRPAILPEIEVATVEGKHLLVLKVSHWMGPFYLKRQGIPEGVYVRLGSTSRPAGPELIREMRRPFERMTFDEQPVAECSKKDLNFDGHEWTSANLKSLGVVTSVANRMVPTIGGLILFGKQDVRDQSVPDARVGCARFDGTSKAHIIDRYELEGTIVDAVEEVPKFIARNTRLAAKIERMQREDIPEYSPVAVREALVNALAHADYAMKGARIQVAIFSDRLEIQNPGMLPFGYTMEDFRSGVSRIRNRVIARVFRELGLMEEWGSGYRRIMEACRDEGYPEPKWEELSAFMRVTFYPHPATQPRAAAPLSPEQRQMEILELLKSRKALSNRELLDVIPVSARTLRYDLNALREKGLVVQEGQGRNAVWVRRP